MLISRGELCPSPLSPQVPPGRWDLCPGEFSFGPRGGGPDAGGGGFFGAGHLSLPTHTPPSAGGEGAGRGR